ncbi:MULTISPECIES: type II toxin-antitoxin system VapC family toxin [Halorussus]|uniref:type II toxin-antitoxin system VapC family toxin n=1 Tax=Halorussus TaxID=1070314 RepID=UPI00209DDCC2|nr:type II toxin-antitoxin system VapC family toxin [Halorussus vallis]USZ75004.1 type II toxin-antitoxin system VapC family toxin [Halorussus vallis]
MSVFIDTGVFYAHHDTDAARHDAARTFFDHVLDGELGQPYTNDYIFDEAVTLTRKRTHDVAPAISLANRLLGNDPYPDVITFEPVTPDIFDAAYECFETYDDHELSFTDATTVAHCHVRDIDTIASFDDDFDGIYDRTDPNTFTE